MISLRSSIYSKSRKILAFVFAFHSTFDVGRSMFDVHFFLAPFIPLDKENEEKFPK